MFSNQQFKLEKGKSALCTVIVSTVVKIVREYKLIEAFVDRFADQAMSNVAGYKDNVKISAGACLTQDANNLSFFLTQFPRKAYLSFDDLYSDMRKFQLISLSRSD